MAAVPPASRARARKDQRPVYIWLAAATASLATAIISTLVSDIVPAIGFGVVTMLFLTAALQYRRKIARGSKRP